MLINPTIPEHVVLKMLRMEHNYTIKTTYQIQRDAIIMERLTSSPRIVNIYGHCGSSVTVQTIPYDVEEYVIPGTGMMQQKDLHDEDDVKPQNNFTPSEKLEMALQMAESIADLHGYPGGIIVHGDIQLCQWLRSGKDKLILGDFNRAEIMSWNEKKEMYCTYQAGGSYGNVSVYMTASFGIICALLICGLTALDSIELLRKIETIISMKRLMSTASATIFMDC
jgi:serine/threonine protein kinase